MGSNIGYWWCGNCRGEVDPRCVTLTEKHDHCGYPVEYIEPEVGNEIDRLRAELRDTRELLIDAQNALKTYRERERTQGWAER